MLSLLLALACSPPGPAEADDTDRNPGGGTPPTATSPTGSTPTSTPPTSSEDTGSPTLTTDTGTVDTGTVTTGTVDTGSVHTGDTAVPVDALGDPLTGSGDVDRADWTARALREGRVPGTPTPTAAFALPDDAAPPLHSVDGQLVLEADDAPAWTTHVDTFVLEFFPWYRQLPALTLDLVQRGSHVVPVERGRIRTGHPGYDAIIGAGRAWSEVGDEGATRVSLPFALVEHNLNCTHDGMLTFLVDDAGVSAVGWQVVQETCVHHQFDAWGTVPAMHTPGPTDPTVTDAWEAEVLRRLPTAPLEDLGVDVSVLHGSAGPLERSSLWVLSEGTLYIETPQTRFGPHPFPSVRALPSFSTAKSLLVGVGSWWLAATHGDAFRSTRVAELLPEVAARPSWTEVTLEHLLDMSSGHYGSAVPSLDEDGATMSSFFLAETHAEKMFWALGFPPSAEPGTTFVYHSSDTYLALAAMEAWLRSREPGADFFERVSTAVWEPLGVSDLTRRSLRATLVSPEDGQAYGAYGLWWTADDIAKLAQFLQDGAPGLVGADGPLQRDPSDPGLPATSPEWRYNDQIWGARLGDTYGYPCERWIPLLSGYGGISVVLLPSGDVLGIFNDNGRWDWGGAAMALYARRPWCD